jgi:hypothetical protein
MSKIADYFVAERYMRRRFLLLMFGGALLLIPAVIAFGNGLLSSRGLALVMLAYIACVSVAAFLIVRKIRSGSVVPSGEGTETADHATLKRFQKRIRKLQIGLAFFALVLVYGLWETRDDPWPPKLIGVAVNLLFQTVMIHSMENAETVEARGFRPASIGILAVPKI